MNAAAGRRRGTGGRRVSTPAERRCDVLVVGGGLAGSALACALAELPLDVLLVEARPQAEREQAGFDRRVTALANGSQRILSALDVWPALAANAAPIRTIHVSERGRFGAARIVAAEEGVSALGYTVENHEIGRALRERLTRAPRYEALAPARLAALEVDEHEARASVEHDGGTLAVRAQLVVAADGVHSAVRAVLGIAAREHDYAQHAVIFNCRAEAPPAGGAFERFTRQGPIALLPLTGARSAVIWTLPAAAAAEIAALDDPAFRDALQEAFGYRVGRFLKIGAREVHKLARVTSEPAAAPRVVLVGDAALRLHPVAGQGFNLALRDIATLAEVVADACAGDFGGAETLAHYRRWRRDDQRRVAAFTHGLIGVFGEPGAPLSVGRGLGLALFDLLPGAKSLLARQTMGRLGRLPRLARGLRLTP
jgi:2-octaprenyl-6-methoxyphenol hydroxylase